MNSYRDIYTLTAEVESSLSVIGKICAYYDEYTGTSLDRDRPSSPYFG